MLSTLLTLNDDDDGVPVEGVEERSLSINTKVHLYQALVMSVLLYGAETWTCLVGDMNTLEAFHMRCQ